ncbi:MBL fold metallo-hydrolase [Leeia oryzae]|uniref:MBL fold metallo-hydrolase n=1 Tax=Leeia oryzae TaxID=356662 RepID=UPI0003711624|nr:MBL fold metallo-hydrolase [Leeia oryzae]
MRFAALGSGSEGNSLLVQAEDTCIMIDCGLGLKETETRLARLDMTPDQVQAIFVTHEHADHISGVDKLACKYRIPVYASYGTLNAAPKVSSRLPLLQPYDSHATEVLEVGALCIHPFTVPHDAREPTQFVIAHDNKKLGLLTDVGSITAHMTRMLQNLDAFILECNHDEKMLMEGKYPYSLKKRVGGPYGHLSNTQAAELLQQLNVNRLQHLIAAHLSQENNDPALVKSTLAETLACDPNWIRISDQYSGFDWLQIQ